VVPVIAVIPVVFCFLSLKHLDGLVVCWSQVAPNAVHYVVGLWSRLVAAVPYVRVDTKADPMLDTFVPRVRWKLLPWDCAAPS
jgi:hypothetical protein